MSIPVPDYFPVAHENTDTTYLDERLDLGALGELLGTHRLGDLERVALNAGNDGVGVRALLGAVIQLLDDHDLREREEESESVRRACVRGG